jgi:hypothetical protein
MQPLHAAKNRLGWDNVCRQMSPSMPVDMGCGQRLYPGPGHLIPQTCRVQLRKTGSELFISVSTQVERMPGQQLHPLIR